MKALVFLAAALAAHAADLIVAAASDLAPFTSSFEKSFTAAKIRFTVASSGSLARQIENGAPYDVFLSASEQYVHDLAAKGFVDPSTIVIYATGRLGIWSADDSVHSFDDLRRPAVKHIAIPNPEFAPYGVAAKKALQTRGVWKQIESKLVYAENVRQALQYADSRNADAVITSWTLLKDRGVLIPAEWHDPIRQAAAVVKSSGNPFARAFLAFLSGSEAKKILESGGLMRP